jgi:hypothetical protein
MVLSKKLMGRYAVTALVMLALVLAAKLAWAINPNPGVLPPNSRPYGMSYAEWGAAWWQWEIKATIDANPVLDTTGEFATLNQSGPVFFLAGTFGGAATRTVTEPDGKAFFIPLYNWVLTYPEDVPPGLSEEDGEAWMRQTLNGAFDGAKAEDLVCKVDGVPVKSPLLYRAQSEAFTMFFPPDCASVTDWLSFQGVPYQSGDHYPNVSDGYWVMLAPLPPGKHTIQIMYPADGSGMNVTYDLTVESGRTK